MKKKFISVILMAILVFGITACSNGADSSKNDGKTKVVRLGYPGTQYSMTGITGIAQQKKFFESELKKVGYTIEYVPFSAQGPAVNEALLSKKIDFAMYADFPGIILKSKGADISLLGTTEDKIHSTIVVKKDNNSIKSVKDLKGKKVGFAKGTYAQKFLFEILKKNNISEKDVQLVNVTTDAESSLLSGNLDAVVLTDSSALLLTETEKVARNVISSREYPELSAQNIFVGSNSYIKNNPEATTAIFRALMDAKEYFKTNPDESYKLLTKSGLSLNAIKQEYSSNAPNFDIFTVETSKDSIKKLDQTQKFLLDQKFITQKFDSEKWLDNSYYEKANKQSLKK